jgi:MOSC domain-containing protein YiiM
MKETRMTSIYSIVYQPRDLVYGERRDDYLRVPIQRANLVAEHGIEGDQKAGHHPDRQLNLLSREWLMALQPKGYKIEPGQFGEQIIIAGLAVESLEPGARLQLGRGACIEITSLRTGCDRLEAAQGKAVKGLGPLGAMAKVISGGEIEVGDPVTVLETALS